MKESLIISDRLSFYMLMQAGLISLICQMFFPLFGVIVMPISMIISVILIPLFTSGKGKIKSASEVHPVKRSKNNLILFFLIAILYLGTIPIYWYIKKWTGYNINHLLWVFTTTLIYFKIVISLYVRRIELE